MNKETFNDYIDTKRAVFYTVIWILLVVIIFPWMAYASHSGAVTVDLSVIGAYLAGVAAPIAFFWLVLGYFQQSKQLHINNETLKSQLEEFKHSVAAQAQLAANTHKQLDFLIQEKYYPEFELTLFEKHDNTLELTIQNNGTSVKNLLWEVENSHLINDPLITKVDKNEVKINLLFDNLTLLSSIYIRLTVRFNIDYDQETRYLCYNILYERATLAPPEMINVGCGTAR